MEKDEKPDLPEEVGRKHQKGRLEKPDGAGPADVMFSGSAGDTSPKEVFPEPRVKSAAVEDEGQAESSREEAADARTEASGTRVHDGAQGAAESDVGTSETDAVATPLPGEEQRRRASRMDRDVDYWSVAEAPPVGAAQEQLNQEEGESAEGSTTKGSKSKGGVAGRVAKGAAGAAGGRVVSLMGGKKKAALLVVAFILVMGLIFVAGTVISSTITNAVMQRQQQAQSLTATQNPIYGAIAEEDAEAMEIIRRCMAEYPESSRAKAVGEIPEDSALNATAGEVNPGSAGESDPVVEVDGMTDRQVEHAMEIIAVSKELGMDDREAQIISLMVAKEEAKFLNLANDGTGSQGALLRGQDGAELAKSIDNPHSDGLPYDHGYGHGGDHGSVGVFQQQAGEGWWGTVDELMNVRIQAKKFFERLKSVGYKGKDRALAGQEVQRSYDGTGNNYRQWESFAEELLPQIEDTPKGFNWDKYQGTVSAEEGTRPASTTEEAEFHYAPNYTEDPDAELADFVPVSVMTDTEGNLEYIDQHGNTHTVQLVNDEPLPTKEGVTIEGGQNTHSVRGARITAHRWDEISIIGGYRPGDSGDHGKGDAIDIMIDNYKSADSIALGDEIADFFLENHEELGVNYVIWKQAIAQPSTGSMDYKPMENRGSDTENHYDHVHVSFYPSPPYNGEDVYDIDAEVPERDDDEEGAEIEEDDTPTEPGDVSGLVPSNSGGYGRGLDCRGVNNAPVVGSLRGGGSSSDDEGDENVDEEVVVVIEEEAPEDEGADESPEEEAQPSVEPEGVIAAARKVLGTPFAVGGGDENGPTRGLRDPESNTSDTGFDSPGLVYYSFKQAGGDIGRTYEEIVAEGESSTVWSASDGRESLSEKTRPGDILVFDDGTVAIVTQNEGTVKYIISKSGAGVVETSELGGLSSAFRPY